MPSLRFLGMNGAPVYRGHPELDGASWSPGDVRAVSDDFADYLTSNFGAAFVPAIEAAPPRRADVQRPTPVSADALKGHGARVASSVRAGDLDSDVLGYLDAERAGKARKAVLAALEERAEALSAPE